VGSRKARPVLVSAIMVAGLVLTLLLGAWLIRSTISRNDEAYARQDAYFTPRMKAADRSFQALSARIGAEYRAGVVEWRSFATPGALQSTADQTPDSVWGPGSVVHKVMEGYDIEVTYGVESLIPRERGRRVPTTWAVLVPRFKVTAPSGNRPMNCFDATWTADSDGQGAEEGMLDKAIGAAFSVVATPLREMPPAVERARRPLTETASIIWCGTNRVEVTGAPRPRAPDETLEFGQGAFEVESMLKMIEQTLAFVRTLEKA
jgi:hypothetical protein